MKSAFELAMERLAKEDPDGVKPLTDAQRAELALIDERTAAKIAEKEVFLAKQIANAKAQRDFTALDQLETQLRNERTRIREDAEFAKNKVRNATS